MKAHDIDLLPRSLEDLIEMLTTRHQTLSHHRIQYFGTDTYGKPTPLGSEVTDEDYFARFGVHLGRSRKRK